MGEMSKEEGKARGPFSSISFPTALIKEVERVVKELGYWPTKTAFIREAVMEKLERHRKELKARRRVVKAERPR
jgi:metal-responsive CopG/Arc/MetJ family transcriptional regulator